MFGSTGRKPVTFLISPHIFLPHIEVIALSNIAGRSSPSKIPPPRNRRAPEGGRSSIFLTTAPRDLKPPCIGPPNRPELDTIMISNIAKQKARDHAAPPPSRATNRFRHAIFSKFRSLWSWVELRRSFSSCPRSARRSMKSQFRKNVRTTAWAVCLRWLWAGDGSDGDAVIMGFDDLSAAWRLVKSIEECILDWQVLGQPHCLQQAKGVHGCKVFED